MEMDREKVIRGLECCTRHEVGRRLNNCLDCPYVENIGFNQFRCKSQEMKEDAIELLKEQEAVVPYQHDAVWLCGNCEKEEVGWDDDIDGKEYRYPFCRQCGRKVKWE